MPEPGPIEPLTDEQRKTVEENMLLAYKIASNQKGRGLPVEDRKQAGVLGLIRAVKRHDSGIARISTYSRKFIFNEIQEAEQDDQLIHTPDYLSYEASRPKDRAAAARFKPWGEQCRKVEHLSGMKNPGSIVDRERRGDPGVVLDLLAEAMKTLSDRERSVVTQRYWKRTTPGAIARHKKITEEQVVEIMDRAFAKIRESMEPLMAEAS
jgi:RNA polymerase sigma factor (sigma-70 family)